MSNSRLQSRLMAAALVASSAGAPQAQEAQWTGFYAGVHADYLWGEPTAERTIPPAIFDEDIDGFGGGAQAGFNYQLDQFLVGIEADIAALDTDGEALSFRNQSGFTEGVNVDLDWLATLRARAGFVFDSFLIYGTGGFAWGGGDSSYFGFGPVGDSNLSWSGYAVGGGAEYLLNDRVSLKVNISMSIWTMRISMS